MQNDRVKWGVMVATISIGISGCELFTEPEECSIRDIVLRITEEAVPKFSWSPKCVLHELRVVELKKPEPPEYYVFDPDSYDMRGTKHRPLWKVVSRANSMKPGVRYGEAPGSAIREECGMPDAPYAGDMAAIDHWVPCVDGPESLVPDAEYAVIVQPWWSREIAPAMAAKWFKVP